MLEQPSTTACLQLLHMDLMGPTEVSNIGGKHYIFVCVDNFSRYSSVQFLKEKSKACGVFTDLAKRIMNGSNLKIVRVRSDHCKSLKIKHLVIIV